MPENKNKKNTNNIKSQDSQRSRSTVKDERPLPAGRTKSGSDDRRDNKDAPKRGSREPIQQVIPEEPSSRFIHQFIPYILLVLALFFTACFVCVELFDAGGSVGLVGKALSDFCCGLFGWPAFFLPLILINLAVFWRRYVDMSLVPLKLSFSVLIMLVTSAFVHTVTINALGSEGFNVRALWENGIELRGGGLFGGLFGELCFRALGIVGSLIILIPMIAVLLMFLFGTTPRGFWIFIRYRMKVAAERRRERTEAAGDDDEEDGEAAGVVKNGKKDEKMTRREEKKKKDEERKRRHAALSENDTAPKEAVFTENNEVIVGEPPAKDAPSAADAPDNGSSDTAVKSTPPSGVIPLEEIAIKGKSADGKSADGKGERQVLEPVVSAGSPVEQDEDFNDLNDLLGSNTVRKSKPKTVPAAPAADDTEPSLSLITETENLDDLIASDEEPTTGGKQMTAYIFPPYDLLAPDTNPKEADYSDELRDNAKKLMETLASFNVRIKEINYSRGPTITRYELKPDAGVRVRSISNLVDDIALSLATTGVRIEAPIPGKPAVGVEVPNKNQATVFLRTLIESPTFSDTPSRLAVCLGEDVAGKPIYFNIDKMPHLLIAGATGMGKSVCINSIIVSILYKAKPDEVKLILVDPKKVEFNVYKEMPHLYVPVVSDPKKAAGVLATAVAEMERRFEMIEDLNVRDITNYNRIAENDPDLTPMPRIVIIIDELADLMMTAPDDVETAICRLAQKARAAGIHLIIGTQRPSVDVITGLIKANVPSRIAFTVASQVDSRTIIDIGGAEKLIGRGDMLFAPVGAAKPMRVQGAFVGEMEVENIVEYLKTHNETAQYDAEFVKRIEEEAAKCGTKKGGGGSAVNIEDVDGDGSDPKLRDAIELAIETGKISTSLMQRRLEVGYGRAAKIIDQMEKLGYVSAADGNKPRRVLITREQYMEKVINDDVE